MTTDLRVDVDVIAPASRILDNYNMGVFCYIGRPLSGSARGLNGRNNTLEEFKLWDVPVIDYVLLSLSPPCCNDSCFVVMEYLKGCDKCDTIDVVELRSLCEIPEVQEGAHCEDDMGRRGTSDHSDQVSLYISLCSAGDLGQVGNTLTKVSVASRRLENREAEV